MELQPDEQRALAAFFDTKKKSLPTGDLGLTENVLEQLRAYGLLEQIEKKKPKGRAWKLTDAGKALKPSKRPSAPRVKRIAATVDDLAALEQRLSSRLDQIAALLGARPSAASDLEKAIRDAIQKANSAGNHGGLVPIAAVRKLVGADREQFDHKLLDLERRDALDLKIANDPNRPDAAEGIDVPGRGLVYFVLAK
jgi:transposase